MNRSSRKQKLSNPAKEKSKEIEIPIEIEEPTNTKKTPLISKTLAIEDKKFRDKLFDFVNQFIKESKMMQQEEKVEENEPDVGDSRKKLNNRRDAPNKEIFPKKPMSELEKEDEEMKKYYDTKRRGSSSQADRARDGRHSGILKKIESPNVSEDEEENESDLEKYNKIKTGRVKRSRMKKLGSIGKGRGLREEEDEGSSSTELQEYFDRRRRSIPYKATWRQRYEESTEEDEDRARSSRMLTKGLKSISAKSELLSEDEEARKYYNTEKRNLSTKGGRHSGVVRRVQRAIREGEDEEYKSDLEKYYKIKGPHRPYRFARNRSLTGKSSRKILESS